MATNFKISNPSAPSSTANTAPSSRSASPANGSGGFKVPHAPNRPSGLSRTGGFVAHADDSSDEEGAGFASGGRTHGRDGKGKGRQEEDVDDDEVVGWDASGALLSQTKAAPIVIAPLANRDWRNSSRSTAQRSIYLPESARAALSGEEVITREVVDTSLNTGGLKLTARDRKGVEGETEAGGAVMDVDGGGPKKELTLEQRALRALMAGEEDEPDAANIDAIPVQENARQAPISEEEAFRRDVETRPEESTLDDYARVPVASFGMALLKGMGWKEGQAASRTRTGMVTPYEPKARPALLGIGAKEREQPEVKKGEKPKGEWKKRQEAKVYVPVLRTSRETSSSSAAVAGPSRNDTPASSVPSSRRPSRSRSPPSRPSSSSRRRESDRDDRSSSARHDDRYYSSSSSSRRDDDRHYSSSSRRDDREVSSSSRRDAGREGSSRRDDRGSSSRRYDDDRDHRREREGDDYRRREDRDRDRRR